MIAYHLQSPLNKRAFETTWEYLAFGLDSLVRRLVFKIPNKTENGA